MSSGSRFLYRIVQASGVKAATSNRPASPSSEAATQIKGIIFDMDGTLTIPVLDFKKMRRCLNLPVGTDILPTVLKYPPEERAAAMKIIEELEEEGIEKMQLQPGVLDLMHFAAESGVHRALVTRNANKAAQVFLDRLQQELSAHQEEYPHLSKEPVFSIVLTRDFQPCKPDPAAVLHICQQWSLEPGSVAVVGDDKTDMICGRRAAVGVTVLLRNERNRGQEEHSDFAVDTLSDVLSLFTSPLTIHRKN